MVVMRMFIMQISTNLDKSDQLDVLADFISRDKEDYGSGMDNLAIIYLNKEKAMQGNCSFIDPFFVNGNIGRLNRELCGQSKSTLITSPINVYADEQLAPEDNREAHCNLLKNTLNAVSQCNKDFNKIFIPIGCQENNRPGHNIALVLEKDRVGFKATILDQIGGSSYADTKACIISDLNSVGVVDIDYNRYPISHNRNDCATITSLLADFACDGVDMRQLGQATDSYYMQNGEPQISTDVIDMQHENDQNMLINAADRLAEDLITETYQVNLYDQYRGVSEIPSPREVTYARVKKFFDARNGCHQARNYGYER